MQQEEYEDFSLRDEFEKKLKPIKIAAIALSIFSYLSIIAAIYLTEFIII